MTVRIMQVIGPFLVAGRLKLQIEKQFDTSTGFVALLCSAFRVLNDFCYKK